MKEEIQREANNIRNVLEAQERALKAEAMYEMAARALANVQDLGGYRFLDLEEDRARAEHEAARRELNTLKEQHWDTIVRLMFLDRLRVALESNDQR